MTRQVDPAQLRLLALVGRHGSLTGAARVLGITAAAVTQQLARAERDWGCTLVDRGPRGARLAPIGAMLAEHGEIVDRQCVTALDNAAAMLGRQALRLRIGAFHAAATRLLPSALTALRHRHGDAELSLVDVQSDHGLHVVAAGELDLAVVATYGITPQPPPGVVVHSLLADPLRVVLPDDHPLVADTERGGLRLEQLRDEPWVVIMAGHAAHKQLDDAAAALGFIPKVQFQTSSYDVAQSLVGTGLAIAVVSQLALTHTPGTVHRALTHPRLARHIYAVTAVDTRLTPLVEVFLALLRHVALDLTQSTGVVHAPGRPSP